MAGFLLYIPWPKLMRKQAFQSVEDVPFLAARERQGAHSSGSGPRFPERKQRCCSRAATWLYVARLMGGGSSSTPGLEKVIFQTEIDDAKVHYETTHGNGSCGAPLGSSGVNLPGSRSPENDHPVRTQYLVSSERPAGKCRERGLADSRRVPLARHLGGALPVRRRPV